VNVVTRSGGVTSGQQEKSTAQPARSWVRKAEEKQLAIDLHKIKETFVHTSKEVCIPDLPFAKGRGLEIGSTNTELCSDWKESTSSVPFTSSKENEPTSNIKSFLHSCLKLIRDENTQIELQQLIDHCDPPIVPVVTNRVVNHIKSYVRIG
jgi:hypothetical protein